MITFVGKLCLSIQPHLDTNTFPYAHSFALLFYNACCGLSLNLALILLCLFLLLQLLSLFTCMGASYTSITALIQQQSGFGIDPRL
jgi:hypothetical protein